MLFGEVPLGGGVVPLEDGHVAQFSRSLTWAVSRLAGTPAPSLMIFIGIAQIKLIPPTM